MAVLQMMGGRFRSVMPSNLIYPGACAVESLPAPGSEYASQAAKGELRRLFARCGEASRGVCCGPCGHIKAKQAFMIAEAWHLLASSEQVQQS